MRDFTFIGFADTLIMHYELCIVHFYDASFNSLFSATLCAVSSIFSAKMAYPFVGSSTNTCVTAPISLPFWIIGLPLTSVSSGIQHHFLGVFYLKIRILTLKYARIKLFKCILPFRCRIGEPLYVCFCDFQKKHLRYNSTRYFRIYRKVSIPT